MLVRFNKPYQVLSQFSCSEGRPTLADYINLKDVYPAGRLDFDSEGLMLLTDEGALQHQIANPGAPGTGGSMRKTYLAQVEGVPRFSQLNVLRNGVNLKDGPARALEAELLSRKPGWLWPRSPPIRVRAKKPVCWLKITLDEGRNRQVRRMTAAVGLPTLRLVRIAVGPWSVKDLRPGQWQKISSDFRRPSGPE
jgi:23S rRNA pseudouridine2457 synthase